MFTAHRGFLLVGLTVHYRLRLESRWCTIYSQCISPILFITSKFFGPFEVHPQEEELYLSDICYLLFCIADCLVCRSICSCILDSQLYRIISTKYRINKVVPPDDGPGEARNM